MFEPRAIELPKPTRAALARRGTKTLASMTRHLGPVLAHRRPLNQAAVAAGLRQVVDELGGTFSKYGQLIGSSPSVLGEDFSSAFRGCLDGGAPVPFPAVRAVVETELGCRVEDAFASFDIAPLAAASIAVVHRATLPDGTPVAVKVLRPGIEELVAADLDLLRPVLYAIARYGAVELAQLMLGVLDGLREQLAEELDLDNERRALDHFGALLDRYGIEHIVTPAPVPTRCGRRVLTMELLDGVPIDDPAAITDWGADPTALVEELIRAWFMTALRDGVFHADVHAGNLLLLRDGRLGVIDWGIVGRLDPETLHFFRRVIEGSLGDESAWADVAAHVTKVYGPLLQQTFGLDDAAMAEFVRSQVEPLLTLPFGEVNVSDLMSMGPPRNGGPPPTWRERRRYIIHMMDSDGLGSRFDRAQFLLGKQLVYFERYGQLFMADTPLLSDPTFYKALLTETR